MIREASESEKGELMALARIYDLDYEQEQGRLPKYVAQVMEIIWERLDQE